MYIHVCLSNMLLFLLFVTTSAHVMITDHVAIGDDSSSYETFDVIVNANYPDACVRDSCVITKMMGSKTIYYVGLLETPGKTTKVIQHMMPLLLSHTTNTVFVDTDGTIQTGIVVEPRVLFHCLDGISRSVTLAIAYLSKILQHPYHQLDDYIHLIKQKRPMIKPHPLFMEELRMYIH
jgi:hypothetical protein